MILTNILKRLELLTNAKQIGIAANAQALLNDVKAYPAAYLFAPTESASENNAINAVIQSVDVSFAVAFVIRNVSDMRGEAGLVELDALRADARNTLINWTPETGYTPVEYSKGRLIHAQDGVLIWIDDYLTTYYIRGTTIP